MKIHELPDQLPNAASAADAPRPDSASTRTVSKGSIASRLP